MARGINNVILVGHLTRDPEERTKGDLHIGIFTLAINRTWMSGNERKEAVDFIPVTCFGAQAKVACQFLKKGSMCAVLGQIRLNKWKTPDGEPRSRLDVIADRIEFTASSDRERSDPRGQSRYTPDAGPEAMADDDIPF